MTADRIAKPADHPRRGWPIWVLPLLGGIGFIPVFFFILLASSFGNAYSYFQLALPYASFVIPYHDVAGAVSVLCSGVQFPAYGAVLSAAYRYGRPGSAHVVAVLLIIAHVVAAFAALHRPGA